MKNKIILKKLVYIISLSAIAIIVSLIEIPIPLAEGFKLDFSEVAILIAYLVLGFRGASTVILIRTLVRRLFRGFDPMGLFGESLAFFSSYIMLFTYMMIKKVFRDKQQPLILDMPIEIEKISLKKWILVPIIFSLSLGISFTVLHLSITPYVIGMITMNKPLIPYDNFSSYIVKAFIFSFSYIPLNFVKGAASGIVFLLLKPRIEQIEL
ncbi:predicted heptaprenyl diphosphate synthase component I [Alteracholeplasma palmae J233]|uniref:Predicted heptaprenyl diphosphate synthase component I n=1 Tax=Alteracholeplasma palmae (strain ATCC 49389 / J233) TaxID=1318466 RepID=U4KQH0_ALTPJ|nr:Gx transporter family protein [Alteracholeplasma palmae]CCV64580.1 predicted heptaprenyl diphosphate synthase component I [Alteracholeplasma palmae J233]